LKYHILQDGWIKVPAADFQLGVITSPIERLLIGVNQVLLHISGKTVLIDTGLGDKWQPEDISILDFQHPRLLLVELAKIGISIEDIDIVILSHLHYDHSGGGTRILPGVGLVPTFTNAVYYVQQTELDFARNPDFDHVTDYMPDDWEPLLEADRLITIDGETEILSGLMVYPVPGHCPGHQVVLAQDNTKTLFYPGDLFSTLEHANLHITTTFDMDRKLILEHRRKWLDRAIGGKWKCVFCHSVRDPVKVIKQDSLQL